MITSFGIKPLFFFTSLLIRNMAVRKEACTEGRRRSGWKGAVSLELFNIAQKGAETAILITSFLIETAFYGRSHPSQAQGFME